MEKMFDWEFFRLGNVIVRCKTAESAKDFIIAAEKQGFKKEYSKKAGETNWQNYREATCYIYNLLGKLSSREHPYISYDNYQLYDKCNWRIVEWRC